jgi:hypothetical protein
MSYFDCLIFITGDAKESDQPMAGTSSEVDRQMAPYEVIMIADKQNRRKLSVVRISSGE